MAKWSDVRKNIRSFSTSEKEYIDEVVSVTAQIIRRREQLGYTQKDLADKTGMKQSAIARLEKLDVMPRIDTLLKLAIALGLEDVQFKFSDSETKVKTLA